MKVYGKASMMKQRGGSALPLLIIVVLLILSLVMLHNNSGSFFNTELAKPHHYTISADIKEYLIELMRTHEYDKIAQLVDRFHFVKRVQLVRLLLYDSGIQSSDDQKMQAFFKILTLSVRKDYQKGLLNEFELKKFQFSKPFLALVLDYASSLFPLILSWLSNQYDPETVTKLGSQAYQFVIASNDVNSCELLFRYHVQMEKQQATNLLLEVIQENKNRTFIPFLVKLGASLQKNIVSKKLLLYSLQKADLNYARFGW